jgi:hypothetical protein
VPSIPDLDPTRDSGSNSDNITKFTVLRFNGTSENGTVQLTIDGNPYGAANVTSGTYTVNSPNASAGQHLIRAYLTDVAGNVSPISNALTVTIDFTPPTVTVQNFVYDLAAQQITVTFSENVAGSVQRQDLLMYNIDTGDPVPSTNLAVSYDTGTNTATFTFPGYPEGALPDGNWQAFLNSVGVADVAANQVSNPPTTEFFTLAGDANRDRTVDTVDFNIVAAHFSSAAPFSEGDFTYDGVVDTTDFNILASSFGKVLDVPPPPSGRPAAALAPNTGAPAKTPVFSGSPITRDPLDEQENPGLI